MKLFDRFQYTNFWGQRRFQKYVTASKRFKATAPTTQLSLHQNLDQLLHYTTTTLLRKLLFLITSGIHFEVLTGLTLEDILSVTSELKQQFSVS